MDDRVDLLLGGDKSPTHFDRGELAKLPPFNDFIRQNAVESIEDVQAKHIPDCVYSGQARLRPVTNEIEDIRKIVKEIVTKKKKEIQESREPKDKKQAPPTSSKPLPGKQDHPEPETQTKKAFIENIKIEYKEGMTSLAEFPLYFPTVLPSNQDPFHSERRADRA